MKLAEREKAAKASLASIEATFGAGVAYLFGKSKMEVREAFPTGCLDLDLKLRIGGFPRGMMTELYGKEGGGKSSLCMSSVGLVQLQGEIAAYIDVENAFDPLYARKLGVNIPKLIFSQPDSGEQALQVVETLIDGGGVSMIVVDSVASLVPQADLDGEIGDSNVALLSRLMSSGLRKLGTKVRKQNVALIFINQLRDVIGAMGHAEKTNTPGGRKLKHDCSLRMSVSRVAQIKNGDKVIGGRTQVSIRKSRICSPYQDAEFDLIYGVGISKETDLIDVATGMGILTKEKNSYLFGGELLGAGRERARITLVQQPEIFTQIRELVLQAAAQQRENEDRAQPE